MKIAGHTMGTPDLNLRGAMRLFSKIGFQGIEVRCAKDGQLDTTTVDDAFLQLVRDWQAETGVEITCLTSYFKDFVTDRREAELDGLKQVVEIAAKLDVPMVRVYGGLDPVPEGYTRAQDWERTASGIREIGLLAKEHSIEVCVETHNGSLTLSATDTVSMVEMVDLDNVGILFDYAWIHWAKAESPAEAVKLCAPYLRYVHYKDWQIDWDQPDAGQRQARLMGAGSVPWPEVFAALREVGYDGWVTDEYEKYWHPELPEPEEGMARNLAYVQSLL
jgi:L-ribulose-5-phosphate 3-epimerase